jgi:lipopolysaccharide transport system ATP-binding protein
VLFSYREYLQKVEESEFRELQRINNVASVKQTPAKSYGNLDVEIISVRVTDSAGVEQSTFYAGDDLHIRIECVAHVAAKNLNVAFRIRNKEGVKVTTWGTLNEDMPRNLEHDPDVFWLREFGSGESFTVCFSGPCSLSANLYEVQAVVALEYDRYYGNQRILHWIDEAAHFSVVLRNREYVFDGVCDMGLRSYVVE